MDSFTRYTRSATLYVVFGFLFVASLGVIVWRICIDLFGIPEDIALTLTGGIIMLVLPFIADALVSFLATPFKTVWQSVIRLSPEHSNDVRPRFDRLLIGKDLAQNVANQIYRHTSPTRDKSGSHRQAISQAVNIVRHIPAPVFACNKQLLVTNASDSALAYCGAESSDVLGKPIFESLYLDFSTDDTLGKWLEECSKKHATHTGHWERVKVRNRLDTVDHRCDISAFYNRDNPGGTEYIVVLHDRTESYKRDDESLSFVSLAVHELRTPLTMLRGYVEVLQEEASPSLNPELQGYLQKMEVSSAQLTSFVHNILNVTKIDNNQLQLELHEASWGATLTGILEGLQVRAQVNGIELQLHVADNVPTVGIDQVSMEEVVVNLVDNAIKYSASVTSANKVIINSSVNSDGLVETTVQDFGVGIQANAMNNLFSRYYRNHRTKSRVGGTGLGLYLCKALVTAHGGQIWAKSHEGQGTTIGFTLQPYARLSAEQKSSNQNGIVRHANGWIKNHAYFRSQ
ncbi:hypothetical protein CR970_03950 [Candidatus Saccharibacteria bacterium]|nr:MAG: hypothetical protein CR970_03950 [Candidatus Saccharibacteria bacterium]